jgi:small conductance mechanosensitive channel
MDFQQITQNALLVATNLGLKIAGAIALWLVGRWLIRITQRIIQRMMQREAVDPTLSRYLQTAVSVTLTIALVITVLGLFGVQTATFAALLAAGGVAIGVAWSGLLANFAAGVFLIVLRPFKVGDAIMAGGVTGTVDAIGLFATIITTGDGVRTIVGNNRIFSDNIYNYSANPYRRVDLTATISNAVSHDQAIRLLKERLAKIPNVLQTPAPEVDVLHFTPAGPQLCVRPFCANQHYGQVMFDTNRMIREAFGEAGFPSPTPEFAVRAHLSGTTVRMVALFFLCSAPAFAQPPAAPPEPLPPLLEASAQFTFLDTSGNATAQSLGAGGDFTWRPDPWIYAGKFIFAQTEADDELDARSIAALFRASRVLKRRLSTYGQYDFLRDIFAGVEQRHVVEGGLSYLVVNRAPHRLQFDAGVGYLHEKRPDETLQSATLSLASAYKLALATSTLTYEPRFLLPFEETDDWKFDQNIAFTVAINAILSLKLSHTLRYSNDPPPAFDTADRILAISLVAKITRLRPQP